MQRRAFLRVSLASSLLLFSLNHSVASQSLLKNNTELLKLSLEKQFGFSVISLHHDSIGLYSATLAQGDFPFVLYSKDTQQWYSTPRFT